ncbi:MAG: urea carboxylase-associated family protein [Pseudomonadota bacterium]
MAYDPTAPDGPAPSIAIAPDGRPVAGARYIVPAREGRAARLAAGQTLTLITPEGTQVCDFFALAAESPAEMLSMEHCRTALGRIYVREGDILVTNRRRPVLRLIEDSSPGVHDTLIAACDHPRYLELGATGYHANCADNFRAALAAIGMEATHVPAPLNLWMNIPVDAAGGYAWTPPVARAGDHLRFVALMDCIAVMSACPQDMTAVNGAEPRLSALHFEVAAA